MARQQYNAMWPIRIVASLMKHTGTELFFKSCSNFVFIRGFTNFSNSKFCPNVWSKVDPSIAYWHDTKDYAYVNIHYSQFYGFFSLMIVFIITYIKNLWFDNHHVIACNILDNAMDAHFGLKLEIVIIGSLWCRH